MALQTVQVLLGAAAAVVYAAVVLAIGVFVLKLFLGREQGTAAHARVGLLQFVWLAFVMGQGLLGMIWLGLSLGGILRPGVIGLICVFGWILGCLTFLRLKPPVAGSRSLIRAASSLVHHRSWYWWIGVGVMTVSLLRGAIALLPTNNDDALWVYLTVAKVIASSHTVTFQPFTTPHNALYPLQVEMHWAALFALANETAVTVWDWLCALSVLVGIGLVSWSLTHSRRVAVLAVLMMLSTPAFHDLMGGGKVDNAATQSSLE